MNDLNIKNNKKINPKKQKRQIFVNTGQPKMPFNQTAKKIKHEQLKDWENAS